MVLLIYCIVYGQLNTHAHTHPYGPTAPPSDCSQASASSREIHQPSCHLATLTPPHRSTLSLLSPGLTWMRCLLSTDTGRPALMLSVNQLMSSTSMSAARTAAWACSQAHSSPAGFPSDTTWVTSLLHTHKPEKSRLQSGNSSRFPWHPLNLAASLAS